jgi:hypothetical protein
MPQAGAGSAAPLAEEANTDKRFESLFDPQWGHLVPFQRVERTRISLSFSHFSQWNS